MKLKVDGKPIKTRRIKQGKSFDVLITEFLTALPFGEVVTGKTLNEKFGTTRAYLEKVRYRNPGYYVIYSGWRGTLYGSKKTIEALKKEMGL